MLKPNMAVFILAVCYTAGMLKALVKYPKLTIMRKRPWWPIAIKREDGQRIIDSFAELFTCFTVHCNPSQVYCKFVMEWNVRASKQIHNHLALAGCILYRVLL